MRAIIGIDPGKGGGIAIFYKGRATAVKMPIGVHEIDKYIKYINETYERPLVFIEKLSTHRDVAEDFSEVITRIDQVFANEKKIPAIRAAIDKILADHTEDQKKDVGGMQFNINKMLANYEQLLTVLKLNHLPIVQVYPVSWQNMPGLKVSKSEYTKPQRKAHYKKYAQQTFPEVAATLATADALCLIIFGTYKLANDPNWVVERVENVSKKSLNLF